MPRERPSSDRIVDAAKRVFFRVGYGETSLRQLMAEAKVSSTAFYARFDSKEAVLAAMVERLILQLGADVGEELAKSTSLQDGFDRAVAALSKSLIAHRAEVRLALTEAPASPVAMPALRDAYALMVGMVARRLARLNERGAIHIADPQATAWALVGALDMQISRWAVFRELDDHQLAGALRSTASAIVPALVPEEK